VSKQITQTVIREVLKLKEVSYIEAPDRSRELAVTK